MVKERTYFYNQTVGLMFVWTLENAVMALLGYGLFLLVDTVLSERVLIAWWASLNLLGGTLFMAGCNMVVAFMERNAEVFSRHYMMSTQAYCGMVSVVGTVYSAVVWRSLQGGVWENIFLQSMSIYVRGVLLLLLATNNVQWLLSLVLTYSCTPFGGGNSAFLKVPVAAGLSLFMLLVNETVNNGLIVCQGKTGDFFTFGVTNLAINSSFLLYCLAAVEFDYFDILPASFHSTATRRA
eukprot:2980645-Rhodomonas_salina.1